MIARIRATVGTPSRAVLVIVALLAITALAGWLRLSDLGRAGLGNHFYAAAVWSMSGSWHNFFYAAYDPAGTLIIDKPPLALWLQVAFTKALGFEGRSMILPMALAGTVAVPLAFGAARRSHGVAAGLVAAVLLAVLPESVATARDSTMDALMMALLAASAWLLVAAVEGRNARLLIAWAALMGVIFNVKYFEGFVVMPAAVLYIGVRWRHELRERLLLLAGAALVLAAVSLLWVGFVELTPASTRPIVMNDASNSVVSLIVRYNGLERVLPGEVTIFEPYAGASDAVVQAYAAVAAQFGVGDAGPTRLFEGANGPLLGMPAAFALLGALAVLWRRRDWLDGPGVFWLAWALTGVVLFSFSNRAAAHYTESYAPALAVLGAVGVVERWRAREAWRSVALPLAMLALLWFAFSSTRGFPPIAGRTAELAFWGLVVSTVALVLGARLGPRPSLGVLRALVVAPAL
ncbi:MAG: glycosyltransferase family 39 protein, partial [Dehalococcoidia bacterium]